MPSHWHPFRGAAAPPEGAAGPDVDILRGSVPLRCACADRAASETRCAGQRPAPARRRAPPGPV